MRSDRRKNSITLVAAHYFSCLDKGITPIEMFANSLPFFELAPLLIFTLIKILALVRNYSPEGIVCVSTRAPDCPIIMQTVNSEQQPGSPVQVVTLPVQRVGQNMQSTEAVQRSKFSCFMRTANPVRSPASYRLGTLGIPRMPALRAVDAIASSVLWAT